MQLPPALHSRLTGAPRAAEPLPVARDPAAGAAPFRFAARLVRFPRDHELFEVRERREGEAAAGAGPRGGAARAGPAHGARVLQDGDVQRHLYLQDVLTQVAAAPERPR